MVQHNIDDKFKVTQVKLVDVLHEAPYMITPFELNDLTRDLYLSKYKELLGSRLQQWRSLASNTRAICMLNEFGTCCNITGLSEKIQQLYMLKEWRLFVDSWKTNLKVALLRNGN